MPSFCTEMPMSDRRANIDDVDDVVVMTLRSEFWKPTIDGSPSSGPSLRAVPAAGAMLPSYLVCSEM